MSNLEHQLRKEICANLFRYSLTLLRVNPPFEEMASLKELNGYYYQKYVEYYNEIDDAFRERLISAIQKSTEWIFEHKILGTKGGFVRYFPEHYEVLETFGKWIREREHASKAQFSPPNIEKNIPKTKLIKSKVLKEFKNFKFIGNRGESWNLYFSKEFLRNIDLWLIFDKGNETDFKLLFGLSDPKFVIDVANFYGGPSCCYFTFHTQEELRKQLDLALKVIKVFLPVFEDCINKSMCSKRTK